MKIAAVLRALPLAALVAAMWLTRSYHFASAVHLPDASWAAFFIAGLLAMRWRAPVFLMLNAAAIDYLALVGGVSDYCVTPAYPFLIPTYLSLWAAGRAVGDLRWSALTAGRLVLALVAGVTVAFAISNASFYALAGYFDRMSALEYATRVARYLPGFLESTAGYTIAMLAVVAVARLNIRAGGSLAAGGAHGQSTEQDLHPHRGPGDDRSR